MADVSNSLPQALNSLGNDVRIISPKYGQLDEKLQIHEIKRLKRTENKRQRKDTRFSIKSSFIRKKYQGADVSDGSNDYFKNREYIRMQKPKNFRIMMRDIYSSTKLVNSGNPAVEAGCAIHCNDWQTGLILLSLKQYTKNNPYLSDIKTVFTIS